MKLELDTTKVYISPSKEMVSIYIDGKWEKFIREDTVNDIIGKMINEVEKL